jgi:hypothetical protein
MVARQGAPPFFTKEVPASSPIHPAALARPSLLNRFAAVNRDASGAGFATNPLVEPAPQTRIPGIANPRH